MLQLFWSYVMVLIVKYVYFFENNFKLLISQHKVMEISIVPYSGLCGQLRLDRGTSWE